MRLKSTGLGATELIGDLTDMEKSMSGVLMRVKIKKPVVWRVRVFLQPQDLRAIVWRAIMPRNVWFVTKTLLRNINPFEKFKSLFVNSKSSKDESVKSEV